MIVSFLDIGSRTFRQATVKFLDQVEIINSTSKEVNLAAGIDKDGYLSDNAIFNGIETLKKFKEISDSHGATRYEAYATHPLRIAKNSIEFMHKAQDIGVSIQVLGEFEESRLSALGACHSLCKPDAIVIDIGGGSTEISQVKNFEVLNSVSIPIGSVTVSSITDEKLYDFLASSINNPKIFSTNVDDSPICVGGAVNSIAMHHGCYLEYDPHKIRGCMLTHEDILRFISTNCNTLSKNSYQSNLNTAINGARILLNLVRLLNYPRIIVSDAGLLVGIIINFIKEELKHVRSYDTHCLYV